MVWCAIDCLSLPCFAGLFPCRSSLSLADGNLEKVDHGICRKCTGLAAWILQPESCACLCLNSGAVLQPRLFAPHPRWIHPESQRRARRLWYYCVDEDVGPGSYDILSHATLNGIVSCV